MATWTRGSNPSLQGSICRKGQTSSLHCCPVLVQFSQSPMNFRIIWSLCWMQVLLLAATVTAAQHRIAPSSREASHLPAMVGKHCASCHNSQVQNGGLDLDSIRLDDVAEHADVWERVVRKLRARQMPPVGMNRPAESTYSSVVAWLSDSLDKACAGHPNPGRTDTFRRLTRTEYQNA